jgi:hypothetical protein
MSHGFSFPLAISNYPLVSGFFRRPGYSPQPSRC